MSALPGAHRRVSFTPSQVLAMGFAALIIIGTILLALPAAHEPGRSLSLVDAFFTATSAVCITGLTVVDTATTFSPFGEAVILLLMQAGGLGIMTLSALMFLLVGRRIGLQDRLMMQEALGSFSIAGVVRLTRSIIVTTFIIEAVGAVLLSLRFGAYYSGGQALYMGIFHAVSAFTNAGFDLTSSSMRGFSRDPVVLVLIAALVTIGGLGFGVLQDVWERRRWERFSLQTRLVLVVSGILTGAGTLLLLVLEWSSPATFGPLPWWHKFFNALFTAASVRTAGFESIPCGSLAYASLLIALIMMYVGGSPGGTGGGIKTTTFAMIALTVRATVTGEEETNVMGRRLPRDLLDRAVAIAAIAAFLIFLVAGILLVTERHLIEDPANPITVSDVLFEATSAFTTMGLSTGVTPRLSIAGRLLLVLTMYVGRIGPLTAAIALAQRGRRRAQIQYPEERVMIG